MLVKFNTSIEIYAAFLDTLHAARRQTERSEPHMDAIYSVLTFLAVSALLGYENSSVDVSFGSCLCLSWDSYKTLKTTLWADHRIFYCQTWSYIYKDTTKIYEANTQQQCESQYILDRGRNYFRFKLYHNINHERSVTSSILFVCVFRWARWHLYEDGSNTRLRKVQQEINVQKFVVTITSVQAFGDVKRRSSATAIEQKLLL
jgi:hypothetical protein